ncbi:hypothetical protein STENM327S_03119 [Streptomyces tendae]
MIRVCRPLSAATGTSIFRCSSCSLCRSFTLSFSCRRGCGPPASTYGMSAAWTTTRAPVFGSGSSIQK